MTLIMKKIILTSALPALWCVVACSACRPANRPEPAVVPKNKLTKTVFSTFGPANTYLLNNSGWAAGANAHAECLTPDASGSLNAVEIALEPNYVRRGRETTAGAANVFIAQDENGLPGAVLESFPVAADPPASPPPALPLILKSATHPKLQAGVKYWLCAGCPGPGSWVWRFNDQHLSQVSAREQGPGKWLSAGNGRNGAFRIIVTLDN
jgi:hypothetical protein